MKIKLYVKHALQKTEKNKKRIMRLKLVFTIRFKQKRKDSEKQKKKKPKRGGEIPF